MHTSARRRASKSEKRSVPLVFELAVVVLSCGVAGFALLQSFCFGDGQLTEHVACNSNAARAWYDRSLAVAVAIVVLGVGIGHYKRWWMLTAVAVILGLAVTGATMFWGLQTVPT